MKSIFIVILFMLQFPDSDFFFYVLNKYSAIISR